MKKKLFILSSIVMMIPLVGCNSSDEYITGNNNYIDVMFNCDQGYSFDNGARTKYIHVHKNAQWKAIKSAAPKKIIDTYSGASYDIPSLDEKGSIKNYWYLNDESAMIADDYVFSANTNVNAHIVPVSDIKVTVSPGEGTWKEAKTGEEKTVRTLTCTKGTVWGNIVNNFVVSAPASKVFAGYTVNKGAGEEDIDDKFVIDGNYTITAKYVETPTYTSFSKDSWEIFVTAVNKGWDFLISSDGYKNDYESTTGKQANTFVGLTRTITLYNVDYLVRVIGEKQDVKSASEVTTPLFTFEFVDAVETGIGYNSSDENTYEYSAIRAYLNQNFYYSLPYILRSNIKTVNKLTYAGGGPEKTVNTYEEKVFLPSLVELGIKEFDVGASEPITCKEEGFGTDKTNPYTYYSDSVTAQTRRVKHYNENPLDPSSTKYAVEYWVRSVDFDSYGSAYYIKENGDAPIEGSYDCDTGLSIAPCFCI